ncbi:hypothetical protein GCM10025857_08450 [Alicyclobacillus contaminans]|uniref:aminotransferase class IV n=1 Tax=Alicyclobacillus contaminans TaxID=392016 RepID=UPI0003FE48CB|nr:aminotransferase class IV [Alicyclobacillus contaminans]GMA49488.1 hypothetical protein GCM10025857_08450 [Alicyclobacillus contaminans]
MPDIFYYQGRFLNHDEHPVPIEDRGHQFGDGVYEVVRVYGGAPFLLDWHLERMERSLRALDMENPMARAEWEALIAEAIRRSGYAEAQVYWQVTRGSAPRVHTFPTGAVHVSLTVRATAAKATQQRARLLALPDERWANVWIKSINLLPNVVAKENAKRASAVEALYVRNGMITEGAGSNAFFVRAGVLYTAPANRYILGGITRRFVLSLAESLGIPVVERSLLLDELDSVDEVFMTSSTQDILPIDEVVTTPTYLRQLQALPETASDSLLLGKDVDVVPLWQSMVEAEMTHRLQAAFQQILEDVRNHGIGANGADLLTHFSQI